MPPTLIVSNPKTSVCPNKARLKRTSVSGPAGGRNCDQSGDRYIDFFVPFFFGLVGKYCHFSFSFFWCKNGREKENPSRPFLTHPATVPETEVSFSLAQECRPRHRSRAHSPLTSPNISTNPPHPLSPALSKAIFKIALFPSQQLPAWLLAAWPVVFSGCLMWIYYFLSPQPLGRIC